MSRPSLLIESTDSMMIILCVQVTLLQIEELLFYFLTYINIVIVCIRTVSVATYICARSLDYKETPVMSHSYYFLMYLPHRVWLKYNIIPCYMYLWPFMGNPTYVRSEFGASLTTYRLSWILCTCKCITEC